MNLFDLSGKVAVVTGGTHGLGMAMAEGLASAGAELAITSTTPSKLDEALEYYRSKGYNATGYLFDVTDELEAAQKVALMLATHGKIDILVNNAGIIKRVPALEMDVADFRKVIDVDLTGPFIMSQLVGKHMIKRQSGKIINICSMMSELGRDNVVAYASAKGGLKMLTKNLATEWAKHNIQVNGIGPGYFATTQTEPIRVDGHPFNDFIISRTPEGRWGNPEDLAGTAIFLASDASKFVNGHIIYVDGGILATIGKPANE
ncbi:gluconate 5-dehydrogenase [Chryseobacterium sp. 09-1422]|jgi:gluconate 5-dehydrogenase|uniref:Gluconate 5-dehydrogenase n=5 Tax=Chryseobacterium TaxID=59732 RepID=A0ABT3I2W0_9FLAO|nr:MULTISPECIES: gluconate 5-dehydrogenase [Chryseobacterium]KQS93975.1 gluconate 5-dehydrogenase [Chryseobacterium sp. Leaf394]MBD8084228.1 gluconate 5-dehydrogenase [Chryseobacterium caseinilyticum]MCU7618806.1 gluconate 5-dehydrogenase [Chryseobacterium edaphi]MCW3170406.1 gluconate 5-dehydrogenase [Chryseobacterium kimseyorum]MCX8524255.1 gluconate 5-dehydrogenase [Chryseobacterium formosus]